MKINTIFIQFKYELWEQRFKFIILLFIFTVQVLTSIFTLYYMDELLAFFNIEAGIQIPPSGENAFIDFFTDQIFFGMLIMALGTMGIFASEIENTIINYSLSRPISRCEYSISRVFAWLVSLISPFIIASLIGWLYLNMAFESFSLEKVFWSLIPIILLFVYFGVITSALSTRTSTITAGLTSITIIILQFTISTIKPIELLSPLRAADFWIEIISGKIVEINQEILLKSGILILWGLIPLIITIYSLNVRDL